MARKKHYHFANSKPGRDERTLATIHETRLKNLLHLYNLHGGAAGLARKADVSEGYLRQITSEKGGRNVGGQLARKIESNLELPKGWMDSGHGDGGASKVEVEEVVAVPFYDFNDVLNRENIEPSRHEFFFASKLTEGVFATQFFGDSMLPRSGMGIFDGTIVFVEPAIEPKHLSIVLAVVNNKALIREYKQDGADIILAPLNDSYKPVELGDGEVVGVIRQTRGTIK
ncbi:LexA family protein [Hahella ganghwensis]|uniref:LexA family protein n=1 Tax=Hahella ganghwensis TaxID=286420 RepID=UPI000379B7D4|nr:S24 family peptidase [Hahella ganghwensis]